MSTILNTNGAAREIPRVIDIEGFRCAIVYAGWNPEITYALRDGAVDTFHKAGISDDALLLFEVPGTVELVNAAACLLHELKQLEAIIVLGCVIRGDTPHFDYVCQSAAQGIATLNALGDTPVIFGVLTVEDLQQALERAGGDLGNKGSEAAVAAIEMANFHSHIHGIGFDDLR